LTCHLNFYYSNHGYKDPISQKGYEQKCMEVLNSFPSTKSDSELKPTVNNNNDDFVTHTSTKSRSGISKDEKFGALLEYITCYDTR